MRSTPCTAPVCSPQGHCDAVPYEQQQTAFIASWTAQDPKKDGWLSFLSCFPEAQ